MTEVVLHTPSSSPPSTSVSTPPHCPTLLQHSPHEGDEEGISSSRMAEEEEGSREQLSLLAFLFTLFRKSFWVSACKPGDSGGEFSGMEVGWPTDVQHLNHVTFDRFDGFLGLPHEFEPEVLRRAPSASATVFGVSTESMQMSYDSRGNSVPTILLLMQRHLYSQGGLQAEGIFRITGGNSHEEFVRGQLNRGLIPESIDVHCLAGLIKAWFRELPRGVLDSLSPEQVMQCQSEDDCNALVRLLPPTEAALLDWAVNLMADVVQEKHLNKMNEHNIAMVFAPNMTQMDDPLTALMYAVQVMNFLKTLIEKTIREREDSVIEPTFDPHIDPSDDNGNQSSSQLHEENHAESNEETIVYNTDEDYHSYSSCTEEESDEIESCETTPQAYQVVTSAMKTGIMKCFREQFEDNMRSKSGQSSDFNHSKTIEKNSNLSRINSSTERFESWR